MLSKRVIVCLDVRNGQVVKGINFLNLKDAGDPVESAAAYSKQGADEIVYLDITASVEKRRAILEIVKKTAEQVFIPLTVGGGIHDLGNIELLLKRGADKVSINTTAVENPDLIKQGAREFGSQCIVLAVDAKRNRTPHAARRTPEWQVFTYGGRKSTGLNVLEWVKRVEGLGAGEILLTSMDRDGTKQGYDLELTRTISEAINIPLIASGGAGNLEHLYEGLTKGKADAVLAASIFHYGEYSIKQAKEYLKSKGIEVRNQNHQ